MRPHSPSSLKTSLTCRRKWYHERVLQDVPNLTSEPAERGTAIHKRLENAITGSAAWPPSWPHVEEAYAERCRGHGVQAERKMAVDRDMRPCGFDSEDAWIRGIADLLLWDRPVMTVVDWKSGKRYPDDPAKLPDAQFQMDVYAALLFCQSDAVETVETRLEWLVPKVRDTATYTAEADADRLIESVQALAQTLDERTADGIGGFKPRANGLCRGWCAVECPLNVGRGRNLIEPTPQIRFKGRG